MLAKSLAPFLNYVSSFTLFIQHNQIRYVAFIFFPLLFPFGPNVFYKYAKYNHSSYRIFSLYTMIMEGRSISRNVDALNIFV